MNLQENIKEGIRSIKANLLRTIITAFIVTLGITCLVGILTTIDGIQSSVTDSLSEMGVNTFDIKSKRNRGGRRGGKVDKVYTSIKLKEIEKFIEEYNVNSSIALSTRITQIAEVKYKSEKTNPNISVLGVNDEYLSLNAFDLEAGRNFSSVENRTGSNVVIIGNKLKEALFDNNEEVINKEIYFSGRRFKIIGLIEEKGGMEESSMDNSAIVPYKIADRLAGGRELRYSSTVGITNVANMEFAMGEATAIMRKVRKDPPGSDNSFDIAKSESLAEKMAEITGILRIAGFSIGFITLLGASIALMNIMMVTVTERTREVGVRKALGATPLRIRQQFIIEAIVVCLMGGAAGILLGISLGNILPGVLGVESIVLPWAWMFSGVVICIFVGVISGFYPAYKASKLDPIESLRYE